MRLLIKFLPAFFAAVFFYTCGEDTIVTNITPSGPFTLTGKVQNWMYTKNIQLKAELWDTNGFYIVMDTTTIGADSMFTVRLGTPPDSLLFPITFYPDTFCITNVTVNPPSARTSYTISLALFHDSALSAGEIYRSNYQAESLLVAGQFFVYYLYLNQTMSVTGSVICNYAPFSDTTIYNFSGTRGWNRIVTLFNSVTQFTTKRTVSAIEPAGGKWWLLSQPSADRTYLRRRIFGLSKCIHCK